MNETVAREVLLVQAFETVHPTPPSWSEEDRAWATRLALQDVPEGDTSEAAEDFIARRAHHALQRLAPREPAAALWLERRLWRWRWLAWALLLGLVAGVLADSLGSGQHINLLAPPLWGVLAWNLVVYVILLGHAFAHLLTRKTRAGGLLTTTERLLRFGRSLPGLGSVSASASGSAKALQTFAKQWLRLSGPLSAARAATLLHVAAAGLALGLIAGLYLRGLVLDYRAGWESTFLSGVNAHAILMAVFEPALVISGITLPDGPAFEAMRAVGGVVAVGAPAAPWIHVLALTLAIFVVLPRAALTVLGALRAYWLARHLALPHGDVYFERLARARHGELARVFVVPYASTPGVDAALALQAVLSKVLGDTAQVETADTLAFGAEDEAPAPPAGTTLAIARFDLAATPEAENHGRLARRLAAQVATVMLIDETAFAHRFRADPIRLAERRDAWRVLAVELGTTPLFINSDAIDDSTLRAATLALRSPVNAAS